MMMTLLQNCRSCNIFNIYLAIVKTSSAPSCSTFNYVNMN